MAIHEKWFISDTHFFHANILKFLRDDGQRIRPFSSLDEMHKLIITNWNERINYNDYVYHVGDVTFQYHKPLHYEEILKEISERNKIISG